MLLAFKRCHGSVSVFFAVDAQGNKQYMTGALKRFERLCITRNENVEPYRRAHQLTMELS
ncbi:hypothetical protein ACM66T_10010 [Sulfurimonas sp. ST-25]|uniref:hypothetical protein n=1 Tax=Sulfurimonas sp. ST-25 TaxID=3400151 RepID=UPI003A83C0BB